MLFDLVRVSEDFPYPKNATLKRRVTSRRDSTASKLACDIHVLLTVIDGEEYYALKDMLSVHKKSRCKRSALGSTPTISNRSPQKAICNCKTEVMLLKETLSTLQADCLILKQEVHLLRQKLTYQTESLKNEVSPIKLSLSQMQDEINLLASRVSSLERFTDYENVVTIARAEFPDAELNKEDPKRSDTDTSGLSPNQSEAELHLQDQSQGTVDRTTCGLTDEDFPPLGNCKMPERINQLNSASFSKAVRATRPEPKSPCADPIPVQRTNSSHESASNAIPVRITERQDEAGNDNEDFSMYVRKRSRRFYVGGFNNNITEEKWKSYVQRRGPKVTMIRVFPSKKIADSVVIRLNIEDNDDCYLVEERGFWPRRVYCKPWLSRGQLYRQRDQRDRWGRRDHISEWRTRDNSGNQRGESVCDTHPNKFAFDNRFSCLDTSID